MVNIEKVKEFFKNDLFVKMCDIEIISADKGFCECRLNTSDNHLNAGGVIQGGAVYTLCDFTFAVAANCDGKATVTHSANISYLKPAKGEYLIARANKISSGRSTCLYEVKVYDPDEKVVAFACISGFIKDSPMNF